MESTFFTQLNAIDFDGSLSMTIKKSNGQLVVSLLVNNELCTDEAKKQIAPMLLKGTPEQMDAGFIQQITTPVQEVSDLMKNMTTFIKTKEDAKAASAMQKAEAEKDKKLATKIEKKTATTGVPDLFAAAEESTDHEAGADEEE